MSFALILTSLLVTCSLALNDVRCTMQGQTGMCKAYFIKYEYNEATKSCREYVYGGCGPSLFNSLEECENACVPSSNEENFVQQIDKFSFCLGMNINEAVNTLSALRPDLTIIAIPEGSAVTTDYRLDRLRVVYNNDSLLVTQIPYIG